MENKWRKSGIRELSRNSEVYGREEDATVKDMEEMWSIRNMISLSRKKVPVSLQFGTNVHQTL